MSSSDQQALHSRPMCSDDAVQIRKLFSEVFNEEMSQEFWDWKYANELSKAAVVYQGERLIAHYGGVGRKVLLKGEETLAVQIADVMVSKDQRRSVRKNGPFFLAFTEFVDNYVGYGRFFPFGFGFPNDRVMKLAELLGFYAQVERMKEIRWSAASEQLVSGLRLVELSRGNISAYRKPVNHLWKKMAAFLQDKIVGIRDADFIARRYLSHPFRQYRVILCSSRFLRKPLGLIVLREDADQMFLMDVVAAASELPKLIDVARELTAEAGREQLVSWCTSSFAELLAGKAGEIHHLPIAVPANIWSKGPAPEELKNRWWLMPGDTDFQ